MSDHIHRKRTLLLCTGLHAFTHIYQVALLPLYVLIRKDLHLTGDAQATLLVTVMGMAYFVPSYPMGMLADRFSRKKLLGLGLTINALGFISLAYANSFGMALLAVVLAGFGGSFYHPAATSLIARLYPEATGKALGTAGMGASFGFFIAPFYAGWRADTSGWRAPVLELGILGLLAAAAFMWFAHDHPTREFQDDINKTKEKLFATPMLWVLFLTAAFFFCLRDFAGMGVASLGSLFLQRAHGLDPKQTGIALSCIYLASLISNPIFGSLSDRGRVRWTTMLICIASFTVFMFPRLDSHWLAPMLGAYGFFFMASYPIVEAALMESVHDSVRGRVFGLFITIGGLLGNISHWFVGHWVESLGAGASVVANYFGIYNILAGMLLMSLVGLACLHAVRRRDHDVFDHKINRKSQSITTK
jgi:MFS family permease